MSLTYDPVKGTHVCSIHGDVSDNTGWVGCSCHEGMITVFCEDAEEDDDGELIPCPQCSGEEGWLVCGVCNADNPDVEW